MERIGTALRLLLLAGALALPACASWFVPESRNRGDIFDEASRGITDLDHTDVRLRLQERLRRDYPPGTPLENVTGHIEDAGGSCSHSDRRWGKPGYESTICRFENELYFTGQMFFLGELMFWRTHNDWTIYVAHSDGAVGWYVVQGQAPAKRLSQEEYMEGLERQRADEDLRSASDTEN